MSTSFTNIKLEYLYRDGGNYKNWGEVIFLNSGNRSLSEVENFIEGFLIDSEFFYAEDWGVPDLHFEDFPWDDEIDHDWHQYQKISPTEEPGTYDLEEFLHRKHSLREKWNRVMAIKK